MSLVEHHQRAHRGTFAELGHAAAHHITTGALRPNELPYLAQLFHDLGARSTSMSARIGSHLPQCGCAGCIEFAWRGKLLAAWDHDGRPE